jgi:CHAD domain-containing protein
MPLNSRELSRRLQKLRKSLRNVPRNPTVDEVHDLRTRSRRVELILEALEMGSSGNEKKVLRHLESMRGPAGKVRDLDVFTSHVVGLGIEDDPGCVIRLLQYLGVERHRHAGKFHSLVQRDAKELRRRLKRSQEKVESLVQQFAKTKADLELKLNSKSKDAPLHAMSVALGLFRELSSTTHLGPKNLHSYRIEVKRLRYVLEMAEEETGEQHRLIAKLKEVQDAIGEWHDWLELSGIARHALQHEKNCRVMKKIAETTHNKYSQALRTTEEMRQRHLRVTSEGRRTKFPDRVLVATSEIAG